MTKKIAHPAYNKNHSFIHSLTESTNSTEDVDMKVHHAEPAIVIYTIAEGKSVSPINKMSKLFLSCLISVKW
jgi:hypothetical protein